MLTLLGIPAPLLFGQMLLGLINGAFYALLSLGLAVIFGMLHIINFTHGALYMMGAFVAWMLLEYCGIGYWWALLLAPAVVTLLGMLLERVAIRHLYGIDPIYGLILTYGIGLILQGLFRTQFGETGLPYSAPAELQGAINVGFMFIPAYRVWVVACAFVVCFVTWYAIEKTSLGARLRAATENRSMVRAFGLNVPRMITLTYMGGAALAALAGVLAAPIYSVNPNMGENFMITVFAIVVIGGMGSILGSIVASIGLGVIEALTKVFYPEASVTIIFIVMILVLLVRPSGLFGRKN